MNTFVQHDEARNKNTLNTKRNKSSKNIFEIKRELYSIFSFSLEILLLEPSVGTFHNCTTIFEQLVFVVAKFSSFAAVCLSS